MFPMTPSPCMPLITASAFVCSSPSVVVWVRGFKGRNRRTDAAVQWRPGPRIQETARGDMAVNPLLLRAEGSRWGGGSRILCVWWWRDVASVCGFPPRGRRPKRLTASGWTARPPTRDLISRACPRTGGTNKSPAQAPVGTASDHLAPVGWSMLGHSELNRKGKETFCRPAGG
jgi:hypothetical protein